METKKIKSASNKIKRTKALNIIFFVFCALYFSCVFLSLIFKGEIHKIWFSLFLFLVSGYTILKGILFYLDSSLLLGLLLFIISVLSGINFFVPISFLTEVYFLLFSFATFFIFIIFRQKIHLVLFALIFAEVLLLVVFKNLFLHQIFLILQIIYAIFVGVFLIISIKKVLKKG